MPTPSGNAPDQNPHSPRNFAFSSCPDADDIEQQQQQQQQQRQSDSLTSPASPTSPTSPAPHHSQESQSQSSWRPASPSSQSQYNLLRSPAGDDASPSLTTMSPMSSSAAAAVGAEGSAAGFDSSSSSIERRGVSIGILGPESMETDEGDDEGDDDGRKEDTDEDMGLGTGAASSGRRNAAAAGGGEDARSDSESGASVGRRGGRPAANLHERLIGLVRRMEAMDAARGAQSTAEGAAAEQQPPRSVADYGTRPGNGGVGSSGERPPDPREALWEAPEEEAEAEAEAEAAAADVPAWAADTSMLGLGYEYADPRVIPVSPSSYLRPGSRFHGTQQSERQRYDVQVEIKHVDLRESFMCGYLRIQGLTEDHPTLTTYFEGEIIGTKYGFNTQHPSWGASDKTDLSHWAKFQAFRPFQRQMKKGSGNIVIKNVANRENIFMRWKEHFLVPDHRVRTIHGASFEGFYYICFNQLRGEVSGIYFHSKSEKFQQLELKHVEDKGCYGAVEFR